MSRSAGGGRPAFRSRYEPSRSGEYLNVPGVVKRVRGPGQFELWIEGNAEHAVQTQ